MGTLEPMTSTRRLIACAALAAAAALTACAPQPAPRPAPARKPPPAPVPAPHNRPPSAPVVSVATSSSAAPVTVTVSASASDPDGHPVSLSWTVGSSELVGPGPHTFSIDEPGEWLVSVTATDKPRSGPPLSTTASKVVAVQDWDLVALAAREDSIAQRVAFLANAERSARGLAPLALDAALAGSARGWSESLAATGSFWPLSHDSAWLGSRTETGHAEILHARSDWAGDTGDGLESGFGSASAAHNWWMHSTAHRNTLLDPAMDRVGVGVLCDPVSGRAWFTVRFAGEPTTSAAPSTPAPSPGAPVAAPLRSGDGLGVTCARG